MTRILTYFNAYKAAQTTANELHAMSDRELSDIGMTRGMIPEVKRQIVKDLMNGQETHRKSTAFS